MIEINCTKIKELGLWEATATLELPTITVSRLKADKSEFKYELKRAFSEVVEEIVEKAIEEDF